MKKATLLLKKVMLVILIACLALTSACGDKKNSSTPDSSSNGGDSSVIIPPAIEISISASADSIKKGETVLMTVTVKNANNPAYVWSVDKEDIIEINDNEVTVVADITIDTFVTLTATSVEDPSKKASKGLTVKAPYIEGQVGELTSEMLAELGNDSITVTSTLTDYYQDFNQSYNSGTTEYEMVVYMEEGKWSGSWNHKPVNEFDEPVVITDNYRKSANDGYTDAYGNSGYALEKVYIDKNNQVATKVVKDYQSIPAVWEAQHLWNHLDNLQINKFSYNAEEEIYEYAIDASSESDQYLMTYLAYSLTPLLSETFAELYLVIEDGAIVKMVCQTQYIYSGEYYDENNQVHYDSLSYSVVELVFSNIGSTVVADPAPYDAPEHADALAKALTTMQNADNYTFQATETSTFAPSYDQGDYTVDALSVSNSTSSVVKAPANNVSATGTVGLYGQITKEAVLYANTGKYSYSMDDKLYHTEYTGLKQNNDGTYEEFKFQSASGTNPAGYYGTKRIKGTIKDALPKFDFSANVFSFSGQTSKNGKTLYTFTLNESEISRDIALAVSLHSYADDATATANMKATIVVDSNGNLISTSFPYDLVQGTYMGYITTQYAAVGTTVLPEDLFDNYTPRVIIDSWEDYTVMYHPAGDIDTLSALTQIFGEDAKDIPNPQVFIDIFGDNLNGPFYDEIKVGTDADGNDITRGQIGFSTSGTEFDENAKITNWDEIVAKLDASLGKLGFSKSIANSGEYGADRYVTYVKNNIQIVIDNNYTKHIWIDFYFTGDWTLKK